MRTFPLYCGIKKYAPTKNPCRVAALRKLILDRPAGNRRRRIPAKVASARAREAPEKRGRGRAPRSRVRVAAPAQLKIETVPNRGHKALPRCPSANEIGIFMKRELVRRNHLHVKRSFAPSGCLSFFCVLRVNVLVAFREGRREGRRAGNGRRCSLLTRWFKVTLRNAL